MVRTLKVGMVCDVITITTDEPLYEKWMQKGSTGVVKEYYPSGAVRAYIGRTDKESGCGRWIVHKSAFKVVGRLIVTKVKSPKIVEFETSKGEFIVATIESEHLLNEIQETLGSSLEEIEYGIHLSDITESEAACIVPYTAFLGATGTMKTSTIAFLTP